MAMSNECLEESENSKLSIQIEKFLIKYPKLDDLDKRSFSIKTRSGTDEQNEIQEFVKLKRKRNKRIKLYSCSSFCVIG